MQTNAWVGGGASDFAKELFSHRVRLQQAFQSALDEIAELIVREGGASPPHLRVITPLQATLSAGAGGFRGIDVGQMELLIRELDRAGNPLLEAGSQLQSSCSALCVAPGAGRTVGFTGAWAEAQTGDLRKRLETITRRTPIAENGLPLTGPFLSANTIGAGAAAYELFGAFDTAPNKARDLLSRARNGDAKALEGILELQRKGKDASLAQRVNAWWETLSPATAKELTSMAPGLIGSLNGLPSATRDRLNRTFLDQEEKRLTKMLSSFTGSAGQVLFSEQARAGFEAARERVSTMLKRIQQVRAALAKGGQNGFPPALLLAFDAVNAHGRAVVSYGDPDKAHNITTYVPGFTTQVEVGAADFDRALVTWNAADILAAGKRTASIAWLGYDAPQLDPGLVIPGHSVATDGAADKGAQELASFTDGLHATHDLAVPARLTMVGHSYGSLTTGKAATLRPPGTFADDLVFVGSPGVGTSQAAELGASRDHVWVGASDNDPVTKLGRFGGDPDAPEFGAIRFLAGTGGHSDYWKDHSDSLGNIGRIVAGKFDKVEKISVPFLRSSDLSP
ncbi:alpha/beta hydrolase [Streptosporangium sp. NPDC087985]|uniref:alpha/beta hydrolase n=1 Tax=Streptosporangium sp. NPDC087985 TaxID=3366196 RepID=UPI00380DC92F